MKSTETQSDSTELHVEAVIPVINSKKKRAYLDNAATTPLAEEVINAMITIMREEFGNPSSLHEEGRRARDYVENARKTVAKSINAGTGEILFTSGGTESNNTVVKRAVIDLGVKRIITSPLEHHCVSHSLKQVKNGGNVEVIELSVDSLGRINYQELENVLSADPAKKTLVTLMHANNEIGTMIDIGQVSEICERHGALFHSDTVQTIGHIPIDVKKTLIHFLSCSAHKFHGPKGIGFLYVKSGISLKPLIDGGDQERQMRGGTENLYGIVGMAKALELAFNHMEERTTHIKALRNYMKCRLLDSIPMIEFNGDHDGNTLSTVLSVSFPPSDINDILLMSLDACGISASAGSACNSSGTGSDVLNAIKADKNRKTIRFSFSHYNSQEEVDFAIEQIKEIMQIKDHEELHSIHLAI